MEVKIELGHKAFKNIKPTKEGYTHDWTVFVQGVNNNEIKHIVKKVMFHLPDSYPDPNRIKETPPFVLSESSSQSVSITIDVFLCAEAKLKKVSYMYDVCVSDEQENVSWERKLIFPNPSEEFKEKLLLAGGQPIHTQESLPVMTGEFLKIKEEPPDDEAQIVNVVEKTTLNSDEQKFDNLENKCSASNEEQLHLNKLLEENEILKNANSLMKEKILLQEQLKDYYEEQFSHYETNILNSCMGINQVKKKIEEDEKELSHLKLQQQMLQEQRERHKAAKRKNGEFLDISAAIGKATKIISSHTSASRKSLLVKNIPISKKNQITCENFKSNGVSSFVENASLSKAAIENNDLCNISSENNVISQSKNETQSLIENSSNQQNLCNNLDLETSDCSKDDSFDVTLSLSSTNTCNIQKPIEGNLDDSVNKPDVKNDIVVPVDGSSVEVNSFLNTPEIMIVDTKKSTKRSSFEVNDSWNKSCKKKRENLDKHMYKSSLTVNPLNTPEIITVDEKSPKRKTAKDVSLNIPEIIKIDDEKSAKGWSVDDDISPNSPEIVIIDDEESANGSSAKADVSLIKSNIRSNNIEKPVSNSSVEVNSLNTHDKITDAANSTKRSSAEASVTLNKSDYINNDVNKVMERNSLEASTSASKVYNEPCNTNKTQKQLQTPIQEHSVSSTERTNLNSFNLNREEKDSHRKRRRKRNSRWEKGANIAKSKAVNKLSTEPSSTSKTQKQHVSSTKRTNENSSNSNCKKDRKLPHLDSVKFPKTKKKNKSQKGRLPHLRNVFQGGPRNANETQKQHRFTIGIPVMNSSLNCNENAQIPPNVAFTSQNPSNAKLPKQKNSKRNYTQNFGNIIQVETAPTISQYYRDLNDASAPKFVPFLTKHCRQLSMELIRIKNSKFGKYRIILNALFAKLENIDVEQVTDECFFIPYVQSLSDYFCDPKTLDMPTVIYVIVGYLYRDRINPESLLTYFQNQDVCVHLPPSESCIVDALYEVEKKSLPHLQGLLRNLLHIIHQVIVSKKKMAPNGLSSLCRVFMEICRRNNDRWEALFLCCELLRLGHPLAPYLINSLAAVWRHPFKLHNSYSVEENMVLYSINYGLKEKPLLMDYELWGITIKLRSTYFPLPFFINPYEAIRILTSEIVSRCVQGSFQDVWMLTSPLVIFASKESWEWKMRFRNGYFIPKFLQFSRCSNELAFGLFCNLYVDIFHSCPKGITSPYEEMLQYFTKPALHQGVKFIQDCAAVGLLKYIGTTGKHIPPPLRDWFLENQDNPKLAILIDLYCKKVMESRDSFLLWDDIIIV